MKRVKACALAVTLLAVSLGGSAANEASCDGEVGDSQKISLSVFLAADSQSDESGFGISWMRRGDEDFDTDLTFVDLGSFTLVQFAWINPQWAPEYLGVG